MIWIKLNEQDRNKSMIGFEDSLRAPTKGVAIAVAALLQTPESRLKISKDMTTDSQIQSMFLQTMNSTRLLLHGSLESRE